MRTKRMPRLLVASLVATFLAVVPDSSGTFAAPVAPDCNGNGVDDHVETELVFTQHTVTLDYGEAALAVDLDGDGDLDVLSGDPLSPVRWYENVDGLGDFGAERPIDGDPGVTAAADLDGDGDQDVIRRDFAAVHAFPNDGTGSFGAAQLLHTVEAGWIFNDGFVIADVDSDGDPDIVATRSVGGTHTTFWLENDGAFWPPHDAFTHAGVTALRAVDLDGDSDPDLLAVLETGELGWYENIDGAGAFDGTPHVVAVGTCLDTVAADLNGDGDRDVLSDKAAPDAGLWWFANVQGGGSFVPGARISPLDCGWLATGDLDGDGDRDLVVATFHASNLAWFENANGSGAFADSRTIASGFGPTSVGTADVDGDARLDVLATWFTPDWPDGLITWHRNDGGDCNGNRVPDACEPDCNANGIVDACDLRVGNAVDCDGNGSPDECDTTCTEDCDADGDACVDDVDPAPGDSFVCGDVDADGCNDCASGIFDPAGDGQDSDGDGACDLGDCDVANNEAWADPGPARLLLASREGPLMTMIWQAPANPGGSDPTYDVLRSDVASDFVSPELALCLATGQMATVAEDPDLPAVGAAFFYLVRAGSSCPEGSGSLGTDSAGVPREGRSCE